MAHQAQQQFCSRMEKKFPEYFINKDILDIGSLDINGNNRFLFTNCNYIGLDVGEGKNVDVIAVGHLYDAPDKQFDTIISTEVFEHDMFYEKTIKNIIRMLKDGGAFIFTCASDGRAEHGTVRSDGSFAAPLLRQISEEWSHYYKNLNEDHIREIEGFNQAFPDGIFEYNKNNGDLYFFGVKGGIKKKQRYKIEDKKSLIDANEYKDDIFVVDTWPDTESKENDLIDCIKKLKEFKGIPILLVSHYPIKQEIQEMVDYYLYDKDNPLLYSDEYDSMNLSSGMWAQNGLHKIITQNAFQHDYAIWVIWQKAFAFCNALGKKTIHYLEYDNIVDTLQYKQAFLEKSKEYDVVVYEYHENSSSSKDLAEYIATYIFSVKTDIALKAVNEIKSKREYFGNKPNGFQLERSFLRELKKHTNDIYVTPYIANNEELNTQAVWNRDGVFRDDAAFQVYLGVDEFNELYLCLISGFFDYKPTETYLIEYRYGNKSDFTNLLPKSYNFIPLGKYVKGNTIYVNYNGLEVFKQFLHKEVDNFKRDNKIVTLNESIRDEKMKKNGIQPNAINFNFVDGVFVEIKGEIENSYTVTLTDTKTQKVEYVNTMKNNTWCKSNKKYCIDWKIELIDSHGKITKYMFNPTKKRVFITFDSFSLGDTIAWIPYAEEFRKKWNCTVIVSTPHKLLFENMYKDLEFVMPGTVVNDLYARFALGLFMRNNDYDLDRNPIQPNTIPLQKIASDILGLEYREIKTKIEKPEPFKSEKPYICIGLHSTAQAKYWNNPTGWQELVDYVKENGYDVYLLSKEDDGYMGNKIPNGVIHIKNKTLNEIASYLVGSDGFVGISSGLSWFAWGLDVPTILISGFTDEKLEMTHDSIRIINNNVCTNCWGRHKFDKGDWNWCPDNKGTPKQFECSKSITFDMVKPHLKNFLKK